MIPKKLIHEEIQDDKPKKTKRQFSVLMPKLEGKFGVSLFFGTKEVFIGIAIANVEVEKIIKRRMVRVQKAGVRVFRFD